MTAHVGVSITILKDGTQATIDCEHIGLSRLRLMARLGLGNATPAANQITWLQASRAFCDHVQRFGFLELHESTFIDPVGDTFMLCVGTGEAEQLMDAIDRVKGALNFLLGVSADEVRVHNPNGPAIRGGVDLSTATHGYGVTLGDSVSARPPVPGGTPPVDTVGSLGHPTHDPYTGEKLKTEFDLPAIARRILGVEGGANKDSAIDVD